MTERADAPPRYRRAPGTLWRRIFDEVLLFPPNATEPLSVTMPGALVWELLREPISLDELIHEVASHFDAPMEQVEDDLEALLARLVSEHAVSADTT